MSLLGKKRIQREEEVDNVSHNQLILKNILFLQEYNQMFGVKEEEPPKEENNEEKIEGQKIENKEIRIIETTIILQKNEKIKQKIVKKENIKINDKKPEQRHIISLIPIASSKAETSKKKEDKKEISKDKNENNINSKTNTNSLFNSKPMDNPFSVLLGNKNGETKENNTNTNDDKTNVISNNNNTGNPFTLFGNTNNENKKENTSKSLFGNTFLNNEKTDNNNSSIFSNNTPLFSLNNNNSNNKSLFSQNEGKPLFSGNDGKSLFSGGATSPFLFSNNNTNPFSQIKGDSFLNSLKNNTNNKNEKNTNTKTISIFDDNLENYDDGEDDERDKPKTKYVAEPLKAQDYSEYAKLYNTHLNNLFLYNKNEKKYVSKGNGFFSIEKTKDEKNQKHQAVVVYRNQTGNKLVEGFIDKQFDKIDIYSKNFNYVVCLGIVRVVEGKPELGSIKIPFHNEEDANALKEAFNNAITFLKEK